MTFGLDEVACHSEAVSESTWLCLRSFIIFQRA